jgi:hypothetical protein
VNFTCSGRGGNFPLTFSVWDIGLPPLTAPGLGLNTSGWCLGVVRGCGPPYQNDRRVLVTRSVCTVVHCNTGLKKAILETCESCVRVDAAGTAAVNCRHASCRMLWLSQHQARLVCAELLDCNIRVRIVC